MTDSPVIADSYFDNSLCAKAAYDLEKRLCKIIVYFKHIYFTSIEKQVLTTYTNLSRFVKKWYKKTLEKHQYINAML